jgi:molybdenum cofactor biosynthesis protein B
MGREASPVRSEWRTQERCAEGEPEMSDAVALHKADAPRSLGVAILTISDTRDLATDTSGDLIRSLVTSAGHRVVDRAIIPDEPTLMRPRIESWAKNGEVDAILLTGGTGISPRDQTFETVSSLLTKPLPGYGELFRMLSYQEIGSAALLSRAVGGLIGRVAIFVMPGSRAAVQLAMEKLILPELPHVLGEAQKGAKS